MSKPEDSPLNGRAAGFVTRLIAYVIDAVIVAAMIALGGWIAVLLDNLLTTLNVETRSTLAAIYVFLIPVIAALYYVVFWSLTGRTVGKWFMGLKVVNPEGRPPTIARSFVRLFGYLVSAVVFWLGYVWVLIDGERKAWHDHMANTYVVYDYSRSSRDQVMTGAPSDQGSDQ